MFCGSPPQPIMTLLKHSAQIMELSHFVRKENPVIPCYPYICNYPEACSHCLSILHHSAAMKGTLHFWRKEKPVILRLIPVEPVCRKSSLSFGLLQDKWTEVPRSRCASMGAAILLRARTFKAPVSRLNWPLNFISDSIMVCFSFIKRWRQFFIAARTIAMCCSRPPEHESRSPR